MISSLRVCLKDVLQCHHDIVPGHRALRVHKNVRWFPCRDETALRSFGALQDILLFVHGHFINQWFWW